MVARMLLLRSLPVTVSSTLPAYSVGCDAVVLVATKQPPTFKVKAVATAAEAV